MGRDTLSEKCRLLELIGSPQLRPLPTRLDCALQVGKIDTAIQNADTVSIADRSAPPLGQSVSTHEIQIPNKSHRQCRIATGQMCAA